MSSSAQPSFARKRIRAWVILRTRSVPDPNMFSSSAFSSTLKLTTYFLTMAVSFTETDYHQFTYQSMCDKVLVIFDWNNEDGRLLVTMRMGEGSISLRRLQNL